MKSVEVSCKVNLLMKRLSKGIIPIMNDKIKGCGSSYGGDAVAYANIILTPEEHEKNATWSTAYERTDCHKKGKEFNTEAAWRTPHFSK